MEAVWERLVTVIVFRDNETAVHINRIGLLAEKLSERLSLDRSMCDALRFGAPLHHVGKVGVSD